MYKVFRTASFKLHKPSARKREVIEHAFTEYTLAYDDLLMWFAEYAEQQSDDDLYALTTNILSELLRKSGPAVDVHSVLKSYLCKDVAASIVSYLELRKDYETQLQQHKQGNRKKAPFPPSYPSARDPRPYAFEDALNDFLLLADVDDHEWEYEQARLSRIQRGSYMPMTFLNTDAKARGGSILVDDSTGRYYALFYLLPAKHELGKKVTGEGNLRVVWRKDRDSDFSYYDRSSKSAILVPLEFGEWHKREFLENPAATPRSALLYERDGEYFFNVVFEFVTEKVETETVLGIDRGLASFVALRVLEKDGTLVDERLWTEQSEQFMAMQWDIKQSVRALQRRGKNIKGNVKLKHISDHTVHELANAIVDLAKTHRSQVVIENLRGMKKGSKWSKFNAVPMQKIVAALDYKLPLAGLPKPKQVAAAYTSQMCAVCGHAERSNRPSQDTFICQACGNEDHADLNASTNIAMRWLRGYDKKKKRWNWYPENGKVFT